MNAEIKMTITVRVGEVETLLSDLLEKVEAGEDVIIARGNDPIAKLTRISRKADIQAAIDQIIASRAGRATTTIEEILAWKDEGRRY